MHLRALLILLCTLTAIAAQPVFSPPDRPQQQPPAGTPAPVASPARPADPQEVPAAPDTIEALLQRLTAWPQPRAREAALVLSGLGEDAVGRLLQGLMHNDWRRQAGCAFALGEMREARAVQPLRLAISDPSNRASLPELMAALVRIDPQAGTAAVLPMLTHASSRVRQAASRALPPELDQQYLPGVLALLSSAKGAGKATALELLGRIAGAPLREEFFAALSDPEPAVAQTAAAHLARRADPGVRTRLQELARTAPVRTACYSLLALCEDEDLHGGAVLPTDAAVRQRLQQWVMGKDPFVRGCAAVVCANLTFASAAPEDRKLADTVLVPVLIETVAGGVYFSDYAAVEEPVWRKLALLTGRSFGQDAFSWKRWWAGAAEGFHAQREMRGLTREELPQAVWTVQRFEGGRVVSQAVLLGDAVNAARAGAREIVLEPEAQMQLLEAAAGCSLFSTRGAAEDATRRGAELHITVELAEAACRFRRICIAPMPAELERIVALMEQLARERSWQQFVPGATAIERATRLSAVTAQLAAAGSRSERARVLADLALKAWPQLPAAAQADAAGMLAAMEDAWCQSAAPALTAALKQSGINGEHSAQLAARIVTLSSMEDRQALLDSCLRGAAHDRWLLQVCAALPAKDLSLAMASEHPRVRASAATALARTGAAGVAQQLLGGLRDDDSRVREACLSALATLSDPGIPALLENLLQGEDRNLRARAITALGAVLGEQGVARAMEFWRSGERPEKAAALKALSAAAGPRASAALHGIVREAGDVSLRREALEILARLPESRAALQDVLEHADAAELRCIALTELARQGGAEAATLVAPWISAPEPALARTAALTLARLGDVRALTPLLGRLLQTPEGDQAVEAALESLTFQSSAEASPPRRAEVLRVWAEAHGTQTRGEWLLQAAEAAGVPLDAATDWLGAAQLNEAQQQVLLLVVRKGTAALRAEADQILRRVVQSGGAPLAPLPLRATQGDVDRRVLEWSERIGPPR